MTRETPSVARDALVAPRFVLFLTSQALSQLGDRLDHMALIAVLGAGHTAASGSLALADLAIAATLPAVLFGALAGILADRWNRKSTLVMCDVTRAGLVAFIPIAYRWTGGVWSVFGLVFAVFLITLLYNAARTATVPDLVPPGQLLGANAILTSTGRAATVSGVVFGGFIIEWSAWHRLGWRGYEAGFYLDAATYLLSAAALLLIAMPARAARPAVAGERCATPEPIPSGARSPSRPGRLRGALTQAWRDIDDTRRLVRGEPRLVFVLASVAVLSAVSGAVYALAVVLLQTTMGLGVRGVGAAGGILAAGMMIGAAAIAVLGTRWDRRWTITLGLGSIGALVVAVSAGHGFAFMAVCACLGGFSAAPVMVAQETELQEAAHPGTRGRISSARDIVLNVSFVLSALAAGLAVRSLDRLGFGEPHRACLAVAGVLTVLAAALALGPRHRISRAHPQTDRGRVETIG